MKSKYSHVVTLLSAIVAFLPVLAVDFLLDGYVRVREQAELQARAASVAAEIEAGATESITLLRRVLAESPSLCTPTFLANVHRAIEGSLHLRQVVVENTDGVQFCDAFGRDVRYSRLSDILSLPRQTETIEVVRLGDLAAPVLKFTQAFGETRRVSAFMPLALAGRNQEARMRTASVLRLTLTNGTLIEGIGDTEALDRAPADYLTAEAYAGELPIRVVTAVPFAMARAGYTDLDVSFTIIACLMSAGFLILSLQYVRRSQLPAFDLERAISAGELIAYYQPVINLRTGALAGCEVLCRWEKRSGEVVPPSVFIDYAEITGLAVPMTVSLMQQVRAHLSELCRDMPDLKISINLFEGHFRDGAIIDDVRQIFADSPIAFRQLVFEITERRPLADSAEATAVIGGLHALGARLAMDDAGTGHSNLAFLQTLGVDIIKIDRVFVEMIRPGAAQVPVLDGLIAMSRDLGTDIVAEGVETEEQAMYLRSRGVIMAQGFLFAPALKVGPFIQLARALNGREASPEGGIAGVASVGRAGA